MLDIEAIEKELTEITGEIRKEADKFRSGNSFLKTAQSTVEVSIEATAQLLEEFKKVSSDFRGLEGRITSIDFSRYFEGLADHLDGVGKNVQMESAALDGVLKSLSSTQNGLAEAQQNLKSTTAHLDDLPKKVESTVDSLSVKIKETEMAVAVFRKEYLEAKIPEGIKEISGKLEAVQKDQLGLAERNKVLQEGLNRIQEKQAGILLLIEEAQKKRESAENQLVESLRSMEGQLMQKVKLCLAFGGVALVALAVLLVKAFG